MLLFYLALGILGEGDGSPVTVIVPEGRTVVVTDSGNRFAFESVMDPSDLLAHVVDLTPLLQEGESFSSIEYEVTEESSDRGFSIENAGQYAPSEFEPGKMRLYFKVDDDNKEDPAWSDAGKICAIEFTAPTDSVPPGNFQRTVNITVKQR